MDTNSINLLLDNELQEGSAPACVGGSMDKEKMHKALNKMAAMWAVYEAELAAIKNWNITKDVVGVCYSDQRQIILVGYSDGTVIKQPADGLDWFPDKFACLLRKAAELGTKLGIKLSTAR